MPRGFEKVSKFANADLTLPMRSTKGSAGYDFYSPFDQVIPSNLKTSPNQSQPSSTVDSPIFYDYVNDINFNYKPSLIRTGIKAYMEEDEVLQLFIRSSYPSKYGLILANSVGIIDSDYYNNEDNEGEIGFLVYNLSENPILIKKDEKIGQGIFTKFLKTFDDICCQTRSGGFGSTGK